MSNHQDKEPVSFADVPTETRMGRRPVPEGHIPHSGAGRHRPAPSLTGRILVWGGIGVASAAVTAAAVIAGRQIGEIFRHDPPKPRPHLAPRFAEMDDEARQAMRDRARARADADEFSRNRTRAQAAGEALHEAQAPQRSFLAEANENVRHFGGAVAGAVAALATALGSFRNVARDTSGIMGEFDSAAKAVRSFLNPTGKPAAKPAAPDDERRQHRL